MLSTFDCPQGQALRLDPLAEYELGLGPKLRDDHVVEYSSEGVLHIAGEVSELLDGATIDTIETAKGTTFTIIQPGEEATLL